MYSQSETDLSPDTIEEKRQKNVLDNQNFLESLKLLNVREDFKSAMNSVTKKKESRKQSQQKHKIDPSEIRRSSRIQSMSRTTYNNQSMMDDDDEIDLSTDQISSDEDDDLRASFTSKMDTDWQPSKKISVVKSSRATRRTTNVMCETTKMFMPNVGLEASKVLSEPKAYKTYVSKKMNVAISTEDEHDSSF